MSTQNSSSNLAQLVLPTHDLNQEMAFFTELGFRLEQIYPADDPSVAILSGHGLFIRIDRDTAATASTLHLLSDDPDLLQASEEPLIAPNGTQINILPKTYHLHQPPTQHKFEVRQLKDNDSWVIGRAGMLYRDLIPDRLGGSIIASHINIPKGGPVPDMVHYHTIGFQLIYCCRGWVRLVYEDQGPPFILRAGDCVTQPPEIRHQVLEASDNLEVIEIGVPAEHMTTIDHDMELPNSTYRPDREFQGQRFCHHLEEKASWIAAPLSGFETRDTGVAAATKGLASVQVIRPQQAGTSSASFSHDADILFRFILKGKMDLIVNDKAVRALGPQDAFVIPPAMKQEFRACSQDLEILEVILPGHYHLT